MTQLNDKTIIDRGNRPTVLQRVGLQSFFVNDGVYVDPYAVSSVMIFRKDDLNSTNISGVIGSDGLVLPTATPYMRFAPSGDADNVDSFDPTEYEPGNQASGIYRMGEGHYVAVLDGTVDLTGQWQGADLPNTASAVADYVDVWTVKMVDGGSFQTLINDFHLYGDTVFSMTEPLLVTCKSHLSNRYVTIGSKINLKVTNELSIMNKDLDWAIKNIYKESAITSPAIQITKINEDVNLPSRVTVSGFDNATVSSLISVTSDNTIVFPLDTTKIVGALGTSGGTTTGPYTAQVRFNLLNETILSPLFHFIIK